MIQIIFLCMYESDYYDFLPNRINRITISIIITTQIKIPTPIPALKIPPTTLHELIINERIIK